MIFESCAIIAIVLAISFLFLRYKREYFISTVALALVPTMQLLSFPLSFFFEKFFGVMPIFVNISVMLIALIAESIWQGVASQRLATTKQKTFFLSASAIFSLALAMIFVFNSIKAIMV